MASGSVRLARRLAGAACVAVILSACGNAPPPNAPAPTTSGPVPFAAGVPTAPEAAPLSAVEQRGVTAVVAGPGVFAVMASGGGEAGSIVAADARTGRQRWKAETTNTDFLAADATGPGASTGAVIAADDVAVPQAGLEPASVRTDIVAREAADGRERWRVEVVRAPVDERSPERLVALEVQGDTVAVATTWSVRVLETVSGRERWRSDLTRPTGDEDSGIDLGWRSLSLGPEDVAATARTTRIQARVVTFARTTGAQRWKVDQAVDEFRSSESLANVQVAAGRLLVDSTTVTADGGEAKRLVGYALRTGKRVWQSPVDESSDDVPYVVDRSDGTVIRSLAEGLVAVNIQNGAIRWRQPQGVRPEQIQAADGLTYFIGASGQDRQVVVLRSRNGEQVAVLPGEDAESVHLFAGAVAVVNSDGVTFHR